MMAQPFEIVVSISWDWVYPRDWHNDLAVFVKRFEDEHQTFLALVTWDDERIELTFSNEEPADV